MKERRAALGSGSSASGMVLLDAVWRRGGPNPVDGGDWCLEVITFGGLSSEPSVGRASSICDSIRDGIIEDLLPCKEL